MLKYQSHITLVTVKSDRELEILPGITGILVRKTKIVMEGLNLLTLIYFEIFKIGPAIFDKT